MRSCFSRGICSRRQSGPWTSSWKLTMIITSVGRTCQRSSMRLEFIVNCYDLSLIALLLFEIKFFLIDFDQVEMHRNIDESCKRGNKIFKVVMKLKNIVFGYIIKTNV